jgi:enhancing lycopene biosynthesis protein 2
MNIKYILKGLIATLLLTLAITSCESYNEPLLDGLGNTREFSPINLKAIVRNQTFVELNWTVKEGENNYVIEFSADDPTFSTIYKTVEVTASQLPIQIQLEGETLYSIRVKAVTPGLEDSKWSVTTANTLSEQLFLPVIPGDIKATEATLRWIANSNVTQIVVNPGNITHAITPEEKTSGVAKITGLTGETTYTADLFNGAKRRGSQVFKTGIDIGNGILVTPTDDLMQKIADAASGDVLVLEPGDYTSQTGLITLNKTITLRGLVSYDKPLLKVNFSLTAGIGNLSLIDLDLTGPGTLPGANASLITVATANTTYGDILISGCNVHDFERSLIAANASTSKVNSFTVDNSIVKNVNTNAGADFIDFRNTYVASIVLKNSTFDTCSTGRDFVRVDAVAPANGFSGTGLTTNVSIDSCTLYKVSNTVAPKRILYVRFATNTSAVTNTLITDTSAIYTNQPTTTAPAYTKNYYFNAPSFMDSAITNNKPDATGTVADPQFVSAATGDFTVKNQTLLDNKVGDPRWVK